MTSALSLDIELDQRGLSVRRAGDDPPRRARVALVQTQAENAGAQEVARLLAAGLAARGYDASQIFFYRRTRAFDAVSGTAFCATSRPSGPLRLARMFYRLFAILRRTRPDVVITFQHYGNVIGAPFARLAGVRHVLANQNTTLAAIHPAVRWVDRVLGQVGAYDAVVINSETTGDEHVGHPKRYRERIVHVAHGFESKTSALPKAQARVALGLPAAASLLGGVGRLHASKNWEAVIGLLPHRPSWHFAVAGQGAERERLQALAESLGCADRVHFVGELPPARVGDFLACLDVFVFPSLAETFGLAVVEAAQAGVPVVANDLPVLREVLVADGEPCALFADVADQEATLAAVDRVLADGALAQALSQRGARLDRVYPLDAMVDQYVALIERLMASKSLGRGVPTR